MNPADAFDEPPVYTPPPRPPTPRAPPIQSHVVADADDVLEQLKAPPAAPVVTILDQRATTPPPLPEVKSDMPREREWERERGRKVGGVPPPLQPPTAPPAPKTGPTQPPLNEAADANVLGTGIQI